MQTTVIIPTYNEVENLPKVVSAIFALPFPDLSILVVDDASPDGTGRLADELCARYPDRFMVLHRSGKLGLGSAYMTGFQVALDHGAEAVAQMDADFSHPPEKLLELAQAIKDYDVVIGSRYVKGGSLDEKWPLWRKGLSNFGNYYARTILGLPIRDVTGGFRMWRRETLLDMPFERIRSNGYVFQVEIAYVAHKLGHSFYEIPIYFADRRWGKSKMSFHIQREAAFRVWQLKRMYRGLTPNR